MSIFGRRVSGKGVAALAVVLIVGALLPVLSTSPSREIVLVARGMAFYVDGDFSTPNPTIHVPAGESVRIVLRNDDPGIRHDFAVPALGEALDPIAASQTASLIVDLPDAPGTYEYVCRPHMLMMKGAIVVDAK